MLILTVLPSHTFDHNPSEDYWNLVSCLSHTVHGSDRSRIVKAVLSMSCCCTGPLSKERWEKEDVRESRPHVVSLWALESSTHLKNCMSVTYPLSAHI